MIETDPHAELRCSPHYHSAANAIIQPDRMVYCSHYLTDKWLSDLGANGFAILIAFRRKCFHNRRTGELRNTVNIPLSDIAATTRLSVRTIQREMQSNNALKRFITTREEFVVEEKRSGLIQCANTYTVCMDDPIHPDDEAHLKDEIIRRQNPQSAIPEDPKKRALQRAREEREAKGIIKQANTPTLRQNDMALEGATLRQNDAPLEVNNATTNCRTVTRRQRCDNLSPLLKDYSPLLKESLTTQQQQPSDDSENFVVVASNANARDAIVESLIAAGVTRQIAIGLSRKYAPEEISKQIECLPSRKAKDPAAVLVSAIQGDWAIPAAHSDPKSPGRKNLKRAEELERQKREEQRKQAEEANIKQAQDTYWASLEPHDQERIQKAAAAKLREMNPVIARKIDENGQNLIATAMLDKNRRELIEEEMRR